MLSHHSLSRSLLLSLSTLLTLTILPITPTQAGSNIQFFFHQTQLKNQLGMRPVRPMKNAKSQTDKAYQLNEILL